MRRLSEVITPFKKGRRINPTMRIYLSPPVIKFPSYIYDSHKEYSHVDFIEDGNRMFVHFNNSKGYNLLLTREGSQKVSSFKAHSRALVKYFWKKYKVDDATNVMVFVIGVNFPEEFEGGIKYDLMYNKINNK